MGGKCVLSGVVCVGGKGVWRGEGGVEVSGEYESSEWGGGGSVRMMWRRRRT